MKLNAALFVFIAICSIAGFIGAPATNGAEIARVWDSRGKQLAEEELHKIHRVGNYTMSQESHSFDVEFKGEGVVLIVASNLDGSSQLTIVSYEHDRKGKKIFDEKLSYGISQTSAHVFWKPKPNVRYQIAFSKVGRRPRIMLVTRPMVLD